MHPNKGCLRLIWLYNFLCCLEQVAMAPFKSSLVLKKHKTNKLAHEWLAVRCYACRRPGWHHPGRSACNDWLECESCATFAYA